MFIALFKAINLIDKLNIESMNLNLRRAIPALLAIALLYSGCKKDNKQAAGPTLDQVKAIATNLVQSLSGGYGGVSIKDGVAANPKLTAANPKLKTQGETGCSFYNDNSLNIPYDDGTTKSTTTGSVHYQFLCDDVTNKTTGYDVNTILNINGETSGTPAYTFSYYLNQDYQVRGLNEANSNFTFSGTLKSIIRQDFTNPASYTSIVSTYKFMDVFVHASDNDITGGTVNMESEGAGSTGSWDYTSTLTFLGNHKAKLAFLNKTYLVDLLTGAVTPL